MGAALSSFVGAVGSVKDLMRLMVKMCDVFNKPPDRDGVGNHRNIGHNRDRLIKEAQQHMGMDAVNHYCIHFLWPHKRRQVHVDQCNSWREAK